MPFNPLPPGVRSHARLSPTDLVASGLFILLSLVYFYQATSLARTAPLWLDEVLAVWTARMPTLPAVWYALKNGSEFTPPLYDSFLHLMIEAGASSPLALRVPSIIGGYSAALATGALVWRKAGPSLAALAAGMVLAGGLFQFAVQIRPYVFVAAAFGGALVLWDRLPQDGAVRWRKSLALTGLLITMVALHFYAVILAGLLGVLEVVLRALSGRLPRAMVAVAVGLACLSILLWWPILHAASVFSGQDVLAAQYYAKPEMLKLLSSYLLLAGVPGCIALIVSFILLLTRGRRLRGSYDLALALLLIAIPLLVFGFAFLITKSFSYRYVVGGTFGFALLMTWAGCQLGRHASLFAVAILSLLTVSLLGRDGGEITRPNRLFALSLIATAPGDLPIATGSGMRFMEALGNLPAPVTKRIVYLDLPGARSVDPTNRHQVERWKMIDKALPMVDAHEFVCETPRFLLLTEPIDGSDDMPRWLRGRASFVAPSADKPTLMTVKSLPCGAPS